MHFGMNGLAQQVVRSTARVLLSRYESTRAAIDATFSAAAQNDENDGPTQYARANSVIRMTDL